MKFHCAAFLAISILTLGTVYSCKKDKESDYKSFSGTLTLSGGKSLISGGESLTFRPEGIVPPTDAKNPTYKWTVTGKASTETHPYSENEEFSYTFPTDSCLTFTVSCTLSAEGYYGSTGYSYVTVVAPGANGSVPEIYSVKTDGSIEEYGYIKIGKLLWTVRNIGSAEGGISYRNSPVMDDIFGKYYNYSEALSACPEGWSLPSDEQWLSAAQTLSSDPLTVHETWKGVSAGMMLDATFNGVRMWEYWPSVGALTNSSRLSAISTGYANTASGDVSAFYKCAAFWTKDEADEGSAYVRYIYVDKPDMYCHKADKASFGASVRCVKEEL